MTTGCRFGAGDLSGEPARSSAQGDRVPGWETPDDLVGGAPRGRRARGRSDRYRPHDVTESEQLDEVRSALADHLVVFLPEQHLDLDDLERITDLLGGRDTTPFVTPLEDRPYVIRVIKEPWDQLNFANAWHSDLSYLPEPPSYTLLHAWEVPAFGGDTVWSNQYLAYETLSPGLKETLTRLRAVHSAGMAYGTGGFLDQVKDLTSMAIAPSPDAYDEHVHPAVIEHPVTERRALPQPGLHDPLRGLESGGVAGVADPHLPPRHQRELHLPTALGPPHPGDLGQPLHNAQRAERLLGCSPGDVPHQRQGLGSPQPSEDSRAGSSPRVQSLHDSVASANRRTWPTGGQQPGRSRPRTAPPPSDIGHLAGPPAQRIASH